jgi:hypothetical protein
MLENHWRSPIVLTYIRDILVELEELALKAEEPDLSRLCRAAATAASACLAARGETPASSDHEDGAAA